MRHAVFTTTYLLAWYGAEVFAAPVQLEQAVSESDVIARVTILSVRDLDSRDEDGRIATAEVTHSEKGPGKGERFNIEFSSESSRPDVDYRPGDDCLLFAVRTPNGRYRAYDSHYGKLPVREHMVQGWYPLGLPQPVSSVFVELLKLSRQIRLEASARPIVERYAQAHEIDLSGKELRYVRRTLYSVKADLFGIDVSGREFVQGRHLPGIGRAWDSDEGGHEFWVASYRPSPKPLPDPATATFGPVIEREVSFFDDEKATNYVDLDTGRHIDPKLPGDLGSKGIDLTASHGESHTGIRCALDMTVVPVVAKWWDRPAGDVLRAVEGNTPRGHFRLSIAMDESRPTWLFRTREGGVGVLRIAQTRFPGITARYKLVQGTSETVRTGLVFWINPKTKKVVVTSVRDGLANGPDQ